jgi:hypothetical protein
MLKREARKLFKQKRDSLSDSERMKMDDLILIGFQSIELPFVDYVMSFYPIDDYNEINSFHDYGLPSFQKSQPPYLLSENDLRKGNHASYCMQCGQHFRRERLRNFRTA